MSLRCLRVAVRALHSGGVHLRGLTMALITIPVLMAGAREAARVRSDGQAPEGRTSPDIWSRRHAPFIQKKIVLKLESGFYRLVIVPLVAFLPARLAYGVACLHGDLRYRWDTSRREEVMHCLERVLGDQLSLAERTRATRDYFRQRSCIQVDVTRMAGKGQALARLVEVQGLEHIEAALAAGKGAILCCAHYGNFHCSLSLIGAHGFPVNAVGRWASNNDVDTRRSSIERLIYRLIFQKTLVRHRGRPTIEPMGQFDVAARLAKILHKNELIAITVDAPLRLPTDRARGVPMDFLNGQALLLPGATWIAQLTGAPVLMTFMRRSEDWRHQVLEILPPLPLNGDPVTAFGRCLAMIEEAIRQKPDHWAYWNVSELATLGLLPEEAMNNSK